MYFIISASQCANDVTITKFQLDSLAASERIQELVDDALVFFHGQTVEEGRWRVRKQLTGEPFVVSSQAFPRLVELRRGVVGNFGRFFRDEGELDGKCGARRHTRVDSENAY